MSEADDYDYYDDDLETHYECPHCGKAGVFWSDGILMESRYKVHKCDPKRLAKDFEVVSEE